MCTFEGVCTREGVFGILIIEFGRLLIFRDDRFYYDRYENITINILANYLDLYRVEIYFKVIAGSSSKREDCLVISQVQ